MKNRLLSYLYLVVIGFVILQPSAQAAAPDVCWRKVVLDDDTPVKLIRDGDMNFKVEFRANVDIEVQVPGASKDPVAASEKKVGKLISSTGQVVIKEGPLQLLNGYGRYAIPNSQLVLQNIRLSPAQGTTIFLPAEVTGGKLPANTNAEIVFDDGVVNAQLTAPAYLTPKQPARFSAGLKIGALPITRGGRTLKVTLDVSGRLNQSDLEGERYQSCFYDESDPSASVSATIAHVDSVQDGHVTLLVPVPDEFDQYTALYNTVQLQIFAPTLGVLSSEQHVYIGNPIIALVLSIAIVVSLLYWIASRLMCVGLRLGILKKLLSFTVGVDGQTSLSLFQSYIWTTLVLTGMFYVFFMSGDLLNVSQQVLVLVGLAGVGSISARWISTSTVGTSVPKGSGFWGMFLVYGKPDLLRLQLFLFTLTIWIYVAARVFYEQAFPALEPNVLLLMGISNGVYVGAKWAISGDPAASLRQKEADKTGEIIKLEAQVSELTDPETQQAKTGTEQELKELKGMLDEKKKELDTVKAEINQAVQM